MKQRLQSALLGVVKRKVNISGRVCNGSSAFFITRNVTRSKSSQLPFSTVMKPQAQRSSLLPRFVAASVFIGVGLAASFIYGPTLHAEAPLLEKESGTRKIRLADVQKHGRDAEEKWVTKGTRVYDITDWIPGHPGGEVILRAAGGAIDQYWNIFSIHKKQEVYDILESYYIGVC